MTHSVSTEIIGSIGLIHFDNPPINALSARAGVPQEITAALRQMGKNSAISAIVILSAAHLFSAGADLAEFGDNPAKDVQHLRALFSQLDDMRKPVIAAIHGLCLGGGLELALAAHWRIASADGCFGLPESTLGLVPGGGGTQRLPRLVGVERAAEMLTSGRQISASEALDAGLIDRICSNDLRHAALDFANEVSRSTSGIRRTRDMSITGFTPGILDGFKVKLSRGKRRNPGPLKALECLEQGLNNPFDVALAHEYQTFDTLMVSSQAKGLIHAFFSERQCARIPGLNAVRPATVFQRIGIVGAGTMGTGIALAMINAGLAVDIVERDAGVIERSRKAIEKQLEAQFLRGRMSRQQTKERTALVSYGQDYSALSTADVIIEAVFEEYGVKQSVMQKIDAVAKPEAILATNTSTLDVNRIAAFTSRPGQVVGLHFFSPAHVMRLLEIVRAEATTDQVLADAMQLARHIGKVGVVAGVCDGFIGNRIMEEYLRQAYFLLEEGALPAQIDAAAENWGMAMGPCRVMDMAGQDIGWAIRKRRAVEQPDRPYSRIPDILCEMGRFGQKSGAGYYAYPQGERRGLPDPAVNNMIVEHSAAIGLSRRNISDAEITERLFLAMANEGAKVLNDGIAMRPLDIDVVYVHGYGFPRDRGGPMFHADQLGLRHVLERLQFYSSGHQGWAMVPAPLLETLADRNGTFAALNVTGKGDK